METHTVAVGPQNQSNALDSPIPRGRTFWLILLAICMALFLSALELTAVSTALPTIVQSLRDLPPSDFIWIGSAYSLAAAACLPMSGACAQIFGRRPTILAALILFAIGSLLCGLARSKAVILCGRAIQGMGGGGIVALTNLILADLIPLHQRGTYNAVIGITWSVASAIGPLIGGALVQTGAWRWLFYMNIPLCGLVATLVIFFLRLQTPKSTLREKLSKVDHIGNFLVISGTATVVLALSWGGVAYPWSSVHVLVPLFVGLGGLSAFIYFEAKYAQEPMVPFSLLSNRTSFSGYLQTFLVQGILLCFIYYLPVYFQACKVATPTKSGVYMLGLALSLAPISVIVGLSVAKFQCYRPQLWIGWSIMTVSMGLLSAGIGTAYTATMFPVLAPLPVSANAHAIALAMFLRLFGQVWGIAIGGTVLQNGLRNRLPSQLLHNFPAGSDITYGTIRLIGTFPEAVQEEIRDAFAAALANLWYTMIGLSGAGLLFSLVLKNVAMHTVTDKKWGIQETKKRNESV